MTSIRQLMAALDVDGLRDGKPLTASERHVLQVLAARSDQYKRRCKVGLLRLAKDTGLARSTVAAAVVELRKRGLVEAENRPGKRSVYTVKVVSDPSDDRTTTRPAVGLHPSDDRTTPVRRADDKKESLEISGRDGKAAPGRGGKPSQKMLDRTFLPGTGWVEAWR